MRKKISCYRIFFLEIFLNAEIDAKLFEKTTFKYFVIIIHNNMCPKKSKFVQNKIYDVGNEKEGETFDFVYLFLF